MIFSHTRLCNFQLTSLTLQGKSLAYYNVVIEDFVGPFFLICKLAFELKYSVSFPSWNFSVLENSIFTLEKSSKLSPTINACKRLPAKKHTKPIRLLIKRDEEIIMVGSYGGDSGEYGGAGAEPQPMQQSEK